MVDVRYMVDDVDAATRFYCAHLGFHQETRPTRTSAVLTCGSLRLLLIAPEAARATARGTVPDAGGRNRVALEVDDLAGTVARLRGAGVQPFGDTVTETGDKRALVEDPSGNPVELLEPTRATVRLDDPGRARPDGVAYQVWPIGWVESTLVDPADAPNQGYQGAPDAWLVIAADLHEGIRDLQVGSDVFVLTWLHQARRDELSTRPGDDPTGPERGVFSTRSPARPNPVGLHRATILANEGGRLRVRPLEAVDGTPLVDIKPVIPADTRP